MTLAPRFRPTSEAFWRREQSELLVQQRPDKGGSQLAVELNY
jgi:hypothetical protein